MTKPTWGLHSLARSGQVALDLDESTDNGPVTHMLTIALPLVELRFEVSGLDAIQAMSRFLRQHYGQSKFAELQIGSLDDLSVNLIKDDEHPDRFFVRAGRDGLMDATIVDPVAADLARAAEELAAETAAR